MQYGDYVRMLILDNEEKETLIRNKLLEAEKAQYSVSDIISALKNHIKLLIFDFFV